MKPIKVLSLFDGMSCGQLALKRADIPVETYSASEIDKHAIKVTQHNFPNTIQLGSVVDVNPESLGHIDLLIGGSPCQSFSFAGKRNGMSTKDEIEILSLEHYLELKEQQFEFEGQSYLFWEYMRILIALRKTNPNIKFLLENVQMVSKWKKVISDAIGIRPILINSALLSAQNRERLYWTNIYTGPVGLFGETTCLIPQPQDKGLILKDVLEPVVDEKYYLKDNAIENLLKYNQRQIENNRGFAVKFRSPEETEKMDSLRVGGGGAKTGMYLIPDEKDDLKYYKKNLKNDNEKGNALLASSCNGNNANGMTLIPQNARIRRLTPIECERLQTVPDNYTANASDTQRYRMLGNGWAVDVIVYIFSFLKNELCNNNI